MIYVGLESLVKLHGVRTTLCFLFVTACTSAGLFLGFIDAQPYLDFTKWSFGLYAGAKVLFKGTEVAKAKINGTS